MRKWNCLNMSGLLVCVALFLPAESSICEESNDEVVIAENGKSPYVIVVPDAGDQERIGRAANLLRKAIKEASGATLPIVAESKESGDAPAFHLGKTKAAQEAGIPIDDIQGWAYEYKVKDGNVYIVGEDERMDIEEERRVLEHLGTLKGVVAFLEDQLDVRFLFPGKFGVRIPKLDPLAVDAKAKRSWNPTFTYVVGRSSSDPILNAALTLTGRDDTLKSYGGHSYYTAVPKEKYAKSNPEYFIEKGGRRDPSNNHLCISNLDVQKLMLEEMERQLDKGYQWVELAQTDGYQPCECEECLKIHPDPAERLWIVHRKLAEQLEKSRPGKKVMILSYGPTVKPPKTFKKFPDNVIIQMCTYTPEGFARWKPYDVEKTVYIYNWGHWKLPGYAGPHRTPSYVVNQIRNFLANDVRGVYLCGGYKISPYGLEGPVLYAFGKALENPERSPDELLEDYVNHAFGEAAAPMRGFYRNLYRRLQAYSLFDRPNIETGDMPNSIKAPVDFYCHCLPAETIVDMQRKLDQAKRLAKDEKVKATLRMVELEFDFVKSLAKVFQTYRAYRINPTPVLFDELDKAVAAHLALIDSLYDENGKFIGDAPKELPLVFAKVDKKKILQGGKNRAAFILKPPFNWDFDFLKKNGILPGKGETKRATVLNVDAVKLEPDVRSGPWKDVPFHELSEISMGETKHPSRFKILRDDEAFYVGVECEYDDDDWLKRLKPMGRDGNAWAQECAEIVIDPLGEREKHCQFVVNPIPDSTFDARRGYVEDPIDPRFGKPDVAWNGDWDYVADIDKENKKWTAVVRIPFKTLDVPPPEPGTLWTFNLCRSEWPEGRGTGKASPIYSAWNPNLESRSFHDRDSFGEIEFE